MLSCMISSQLIWNTKQDDSKNLAIHSGPTASQDQIYVFLGATRAKTVSYYFRMGP